MIHSEMNHRNAEREKIKLEIDAFLASGGSIEVLPASPDNTAQQKPRTAYGRGRTPDGATRPRHNLRR